MTPDEPDRNPEKTLLVEATADQVKQVFGDFLDRAGFRGQRIVITRHGKKIAALVGMPDLERLEGAA